MDGLGKAGKRLPKSRQSGQSTVGSCMSGRRW